MATVTTTITPAPQQFSYAGLPDVFIPATPNAAGEVRFTAFDQVIAATGAGDNQAVNIQCDLPVGFAYVLVDLSLALAGNTPGSANRWNTDLFAVLQNGTSGAHDFEYWLQMSTMGDANSLTDRRSKIYCPCQYPKLTVQGGQESVRLDIQGYNTTANDQAYLAHFFARFMRYTVEQASHYAVNTPIPVR